jgi:hypothetical protein
MKTIITIAALLCLTATIATAKDTYVNGYVKSNGTYVNGYYKSAPDNSHNNNYSTQGNYNPYTGKSGSESSTWNDKTPEKNTQTYGSPGYNNYNYGR